MYLINDTTTGETVARCKLWTEAVREVAYLKWQHARNYSIVDTLMLDARARYLHSEHYDQQMSSIKQLTSLNYDVRVIAVEHIDITELPA